MKLNNGTLFVLSLLAREESTQQSTTPGTVYRLDFTRQKTGYYGSDARTKVVPAMDDGSPPLPRVEHPPNDGYQQRYCNRI